MPRPEITPASVRVDRPAGVMKITWQDGHSSIYPIPYLREECPCAVCRGTHGPAMPYSMTPLADKKPPEIVDVEFIGRNVAIRFTWNDGHDGGIYDWVYMREVCPCDDCTAKRTADDS